MERRTIVRALRAVRRRKGWSQRQLAVRIGISKSEMSRWESDALDKCSIEEVERWATALGAHVRLELRVNGDRPLTDARHARIQNWLAALLRSAGWVVEPEASFNVFGDRGRIDILAYHPVAHVVLVVEIKTRVDDAQDLLGGLDIKKRVTPKLAADRGWSVAAVVPAIFVLEGTTARRRLDEHGALFAPFSLRARAAMAWLRQPKPPTPSGILALVSPPVQG
jgi:transcriptional regulator with XRE-family HTH domain